MSRDGSGSDVLGVLVLECCGGGSGGEAEGQDCGAVCEGDGGGGHGGDGTRGGEGGGNGDGVDGSGKVVMMK